MTDKKLPKRLHHTAYTTKDMEKTRKFYEEVIGLPLVATWSESDELFGAVRTYVHCFFGLADGSALAFFQFARPEDQTFFSPPIPESAFHHIALAVDEDVQRGIRQRIAAAGIREPNTFVLEHGYCTSLYVKDPNNMILEFTVDHPKAESINATRREHARGDLAKWLGGDHTSNNVYR